MQQSSDVANVMRTASKGEARDREMRRGGRERAAWSEEGERETQKSDERR